MSPPTGQNQVYAEALSAYSTQLGYYDQEAGKFGGLVDEADVSNEAWGVMGAFAKSGYTERLTELRSLLEEMKQGVEQIQTAMRDTAAIYQGTEDAAVMTFGGHQAMVDGQ
ncbi:hypothetical protein [Actinokineospora pegani]|uniref:hypothetical protein n=1 Tax=Actinokineospora pegani TaxID=2654637 RepID=UPI0012EA233E|nr:hypothetical protein [Actinokineospora pegani]